MKLSPLLPNWIKNIFRFLAYRYFRKNVFREIKIRVQQNKLITHFDPNTKKLIVFLTEGADIFTGHENISGGLMSITSLFEETLNLKSIHNAEAIMCTHPFAPLILKHTQYPNNNVIFRFSQIFSYFKNLDFLMIHSLCFITPDLGVYLKKYKNNISKISKFQINILNQNVTLMPTNEELSTVFKWTPNITQTTAHKKYSTKEYRSRFHFPLHHFSVYASPEKYNRMPYTKKKNCIMVSPDERSEKHTIIEKIKNSFPNYEIIIIQNIKYLEYLKIAGSAKFAITFGEGLDFYFVDTIFSGGVSFAIYNEEFFTGDFKNLTGLFNSYSEMEDNIISKIIELDNELVYQESNHVQFQACSKYYNYAQYKQNLTDFYQEKYTFQ